MTPATRTSLTPIIIARDPGPLAWPSLGEDIQWIRRLACATCDGFFYRNKEMVVVGGREHSRAGSALSVESCSKVTVRPPPRSFFAAESILQDRLLSKPNVDVIWNHVIDEVIGEREPRKSVTGVRIRNVKTGEEGVYRRTAFSSRSDTIRQLALFRGQLDMDATATSRSAPGDKTTVPGVQAAGDVIDPVFRRRSVPPAWDVWRPWKPRNS